MRGKLKLRLLCAAVAIAAALCAAPASAFAAESAAPAAAEEQQAGIYAEIPVSGFTASGLLPGSDKGVDFAEIWYSEWDDCRYLFLPAFADCSRLTLSYKADDTLYIGDKPIVSGETTDALAEGDSFRLKVGDEDCGELRVMQSNLGCAFISTDSGSLSALDNGFRLHTETGSILMLDADGSVEYDGAMEKLSAHGNSSWDYSKKKSYNLKLPKKADLYGMGKAKKWALISNYLDHSALRNKITEEMCRAAGVECVMDSTFIDLYADGSYRGTYQLCERVQVRKNRVDIRDLEEATEKLNEFDLEEYPRKVVGASGTGVYKENSYKYYDIPNDPADISGGYLIQFQLWNRYGQKADSGFVTSRGLAVEIDGPEKASKAQVEYIRNFVQEAEDAIYSETGRNSKGKRWTDYIDEDSFVMAYLVQEITMNIDAGCTSFYAWKDSDERGNGKLHFSPAWDFDFSYGSFPTTKTNSEGASGKSWNPNNLFATCFPMSGYKDSKREAVAGVNWIGALYKREAFVRRAAELYFERFEPFLKELTEGEEPLSRRIAETILPSAEMSNARWHTYGGADYCVFGSSSGATFLDSVELVRDFAERRKNYLSKLWAPSVKTRGDVNADGDLSVADLLLLHKFVLADGDLPDPIAADLCRDGVIDSFDLCALRSELLSGGGL